MQTEYQIPGFEISPKVERLTAAAGALFIGGGSGFTAYFDPTTQHFFPVCPLFALTGFACPGCGLTRGFHALFNGDVVTALDFNLLIPIWAVILSYVFVSLVLTAVRGKGLPMWPTNARFMWGFMIALLAFGVLRNIPVWPFTFLFP